MRENRQSGSEGGARLNPFVPTPILAQLQKQFPEIQWKAFLDTYGF